MGTDIHLTIERFDSDLQEWEVVSPENLAPQDDWEKEQGRWSWYGGRNYSLFAILADVRNGTPDGSPQYGIVRGYFKPIAPLRGIPKDASAEYREDAERGWGHSYTWLTLKEVLDYDWSQTSTRRGYLSPMEFAELHFRDRPIPTCWAGGTSAEKLSLDRMQRYLKTSYFLKTLETTRDRWRRIVEEEAPDRAKWRESDIAKKEMYEAMCEDMVKRHSPGADSQFREIGFYALLYEWEQSYADCCSYFLGEVVPLLQTLHEDPEKIRLCFYFDS